MAQHQEEQRYILMQNETAECIEYIVQEGAGGGVRDPEKDCQLGIRSWNRMESEESSQLLDLKPSRIVILKNIPPGTRVVFRPENSINTESQAQQESRDQPKPANSDIAA